MFTKEFGLMLYVEDVAAEKAFWKAAGFTILNEAEMMGFETFDMKPHAEPFPNFNFSSPSGHYFAVKG